MKQINYKKLILPNIPYVFFVYLFDKVGQAVRLAPGADISAKILNITQGFSAAFESALPSIYPRDLLVGIVGAVIIRLIVYVKGKNAKKYRKGAEYGSARWSAAEDGAPLIDESPLSLACSVVDVYETDGFETFVLAIDGTYVDEACLDEKGKIDYGRVAPVLFEFPTYSYWRLGERVGGCLRLDRE